MSSGDDIALLTMPTLRAAATPEVSGPRFGEALLQIAPDKIHIPERLGLYFPDKATALGRLMAVHGHRTPVTVRKSESGTMLPWTLVVGMHRVSGALQAGLPFVYSLERIGLSASDALDEEASENLDRRDQPPLERAIFIHATCVAARERISREHGGASDRELGAKARWAKVKAGEVRAEQVLQEESDDAADIMSGAYGWQESVAAAFDRDTRSIRRALQLYRLVIEPFPELTQALSDHPVVGNNAAQLKAIADVREEAQRRAVIEQLLGDSSLSADEARITVGVDHQAGPAPLPHQKHFNAIEGGWSRLGPAYRRDFLPRLVGMLTPDLKRRLRELLDAELDVGELAHAG